MPLPPISFPTLGWQIAEWMEAYLCHGPGDVQGEDLQIDDELTLHLCWLYRVWPQGHKLAGRRLVHHDVLSRPKGRAKSEFAGAFVLAEALGPVRCDGFDSNGDPVGVPVIYPFIRCLATEEEQAGNTYDNVVYMIEHGEVGNAYLLDPGVTKTYVKEPGGGEIVPSTSGDASKDGGKESAAVADETHLYVQRVLREMYRTVARNTGKRKKAEPLMLETTTAWQDGERSIAEQTAERFAAIEIEEAVQKHGILYDHRQGLEPKRFGDNRSLIKAMREGYGPAAEWMDFERIVKLIREAEEPEQEAYRYWLNIPRKAAKSWLGKGEIQDALTDELPKSGSKVTLGFDGSLNDDHTTLWLCTEDALLIPIGYWTPSLEEDSSWHAEVDHAVAWAFENFQVIRFYGDPPYWTSEIGTWAATYSDPARPGTLPVMEFWTNVDSKMGVACGALRTALRQDDARINPIPLQTPEQWRTADGRVALAGDGTTLAVWHTENARTRKVRIRLEDRAEEAYIVQKNRPGSPLKIDSVPSMVLARRARDDAVKLGEFATPDYGRASFSGGKSSSGRASKRVEKADYIPCRGCGKSIHPRLHAPDAPEQGKCKKCRLGKPAT